MIYKKIKTIICQDVDISNEMKFTSYINDIRLFMGKFKDPKPEKEEAVEKAKKYGFCIEALMKNERVGVLVITRSPFDKFQPKYHLAYIAVAENHRGQGIGVVLLELSKEITKNSIALHVGFKNTQAISFYKKMGWQETYCRMMPKE